jgi:hypothetical protein
VKGIWQQTSEVAKKKALNKNTHLQKHIVEKTHICKKLIIKHESLSQPQHSC